MKYSKSDSVVGPAQTTEGAIFAHIEKLPRPARYWQAPRCQGEVKDGTKRWRDHANRDYRCDRKAVFEVDGRNLCQLHAGDLLIERALRQMEGDRT